MNQLQSGIFAAAEGLLGQGQAEDAVELLSQHYGQFRHDHLIGGCAAGKLAEVHGRLGSAGPARQWKDAAVHVLRTGKTEARLQAEAAMESQDYASAVKCVERLIQFCELLERPPDVYVEWLREIRPFVQEETEPERPSTCTDELLRGVGDLRPERQRGRCAAGDLLGKGDLAEQVSAQQDGTDKHARRSGAPLPPPPRPPRSSLPLPPPPPPPDGRSPPRKRRRSRSDGRRRRSRSGSPRRRRRESSPVRRRVASFLEAVMSSVREDSTRALACQRELKRGGGILESLESEVQKGTARQKEEESRQLAGTVTKWSTPRGFGFIRDHETRSTYFCHVSVLGAGCVLEEGDEVQFTVGLSARTGRPCVLTASRPGAVAADAKRSRRSTPDPFEIGRARYRRRPEGDQARRVRECYQRQLEACGSLMEMKPFASRINYHRILHGDEPGDKEAAAHLSSMVSRVSLIAKTGVDGFIDNFNFCPSGLLYRDDFLTPVEEALIMASIDGSRWSKEISRRTQQFGFKFDYGDQDRLRTAAPLPAWSGPVLDKLMDTGVCTVRPNQIIVNEYRSGQGIGPHADRHVFEDEIVTISMGDSWRMLWINQADHIAEEYGVPIGGFFTVRLQRRSVTRFCGEARWKWFHCIPQVSNEVTADHTVVPRQRRVSLTFRHVDQKKWDALRGAGAIRRPRVQGLGRGGGTAEGSEMDRNTATDADVPGPGADVPGLDADGPGPDADVPGPTAVGEDKRVAAGVGDGVGLAAGQNPIAAAAKAIAAAAAAAQRVPEAADCASVTATAGGEARFRRVRPSGVSLKATGVARHRP